jgi:hypothetical protein
MHVERGTLLQAYEEASREKLSSPVVKEERYFAPNDDAQGGGPAEDQSSGDGA